MIYSEFIHPKGK